MSRRRRHNTNATSTTTTPSYSTVANPTGLFGFSQTFRPSVTSNPYDDMGLHDRRHYNPTSAYSAPAARTAKAARLVIKTLRHGPSLPHQLKFAVPKDVAVCIRRKMRRSVLMAIKVNKSRAGRGRKRRNAYSNIGC